VAAASSNSSYPPWSCMASQQVCVCVCVSGFSEGVNGFSHGASLHLASLAAEHLALSGTLQAALRLRTCACADLGIAPQELGSPFSRLCEGLSRGT